MNFFNLIGALGTILMPIHKVYPNDFNYSTDATCHVDDHESILKVYGNSVNMTLDYDYDYTYTLFAKYWDDITTSDLQVANYVSEGLSTHITGIYHTGSSSEYFSVVLKTKIFDFNYHIDNVNITNTKFHNYNEDIFVYTNFNTAHSGYVEAGDVLDDATGLLWFNYGLENGRSIIEVYQAFSFYAWYDSGEPTRDFISDINAILVSEMNVQCNVSTYNVTENVDLSSLFFDFLTMPFVFYSTLFGFEVFGINIYFFIICP